jgi:hypothetical protein
MKKYNAFKLLCLLMTGFWAACDEDRFSPIIDIELPQFPPRITIVGGIVGGADSVEVFVTKSRNFGDTTSYNVFVTDSFPIAFDPVTLLPTKWSYRYYRGNTDTIGNVVVELLKNDVVIAQLKYRKQGSYFAKLPTPLSTSDGATYTIRASATGFPTAEATQKMPAFVKIDTALFRRNVSIPDPSDPFYIEKLDEFTVRIQDPSVSEGNYYALSATYRYPPQTAQGEFDFALFSRDPLSEANFFSDLSFNGKQVELKSHTYDQFGSSGSSQIQPGMRFTYALHSTTADRFRYAVSRNAFENAAGNPFAEPVILYSNVKNGYGIFTAQNISYFTLKF